MKKLIAICIVAAFAASCKKDYTCVCTSVDTSGNTPVTTVDTYKSSSNKKDADAWCAAIPKSTVNIGGVSSPADVGTCVIK